jgi:hypothetical protein
MQVRSNKDPRIIAMTGKRFGKLLVLEQAPYMGKLVAWFCKCDCGRTVAIRGTDLRSGHSTSCKFHRTGGLRHGGCGTGAYISWGAMKERCLNQKNKKFKDYGGRGITVCEGWMKFENFLNDMGPRPIGLELDRINNNGNYEPGNCKWSTRIEQRNNSRSAKEMNHDFTKHKKAHNLTCAGKTLHLAAWAETLKIAQSSLRGRLKRGWSVEKALTTPKRGTHA